MTEKTDFGFKKVDKNKKSTLVGKVFSNVATKYDLMNDLMSGGIHRSWKNKMIQEIKFTKNTNYNIIDVAGGTGDIAFRIANKANQENIDTKIEIVDINQEMLGVGKERSINLNHFNQVNFNRCDGESLDYEDNFFDYYTIAFGIRNFTNIDKGLEEAHRVLKKGGKFICLEFSKVNNKILETMYNHYSFKVVPKIGELVLGDKESYQYLVESIRKFPKQEDFLDMIEGAGFKSCKYHNLTFGSVAIHVGYKL
jgi:demethylmenaquinone methyltransferase/2-methoxy-6-polyprenyl-1,4-benzoquinol methylase